MKERKSNLDERQEQALLKIEHNGCWLAFWGLLIAMAVQLIVYGFDMKLLAGEWIVFMALCLYICSSCLKQGIWDRQLKPDRKTNLLASLVAGLAFGVLMFFSIWKNFPDKPLGAAAGALISGGIIFAICFCALSISAKQMKKRQEQLEKEENENEEEEEK